MLKLNFILFKKYACILLIQIQHLLKLNSNDKGTKEAKKVNSNTTLVKVKFYTGLTLQKQQENSNTTLVKVKCKKSMFMKTLESNSNTTLVKVKC